MARPLKEGLDYFPLDCRMDRKIEMLESIHGLEGFAVYIKLLQELYQTNLGEIKIEEGKFSTWKILGKRYGIQEESLKDIMDTLLELNLFDKKNIENGILTSDGVKKRLQSVDSIRFKDRERKQVIHKDSVRKGTQSKVKESKGKQSKTNGVRLKSFFSLWNLYPKKDGQKAAERFFMGSIKKEEDFKRISKALNNYIKHIKDNNIETRFIKNGSTWFNNWQDWVDYSVKDFSNTENKGRAGKEIIC